MSSITRRQHWVPRFYLKRFATSESQSDENPRVWTYSSGSAPKQIGINNIALENYAYSPLDAAGKRDDQVEKWLAGIEGTCASVWNGFAETDFDFGPPSSIKQLLALFLAIQVTRTPRHRELVANLQRGLVEAFDQLPKDATGQPIASTIQIGAQIHQIDNSGWNDFRNADPEAVKRMWVEQLQKHPSAVAGLLLRKRWSIMRAPQPAFATSDCPVRFIDADDQSRGVIIVFPLSPTRLLFLDDKHSDPAGLIFEAPPAAVMEFNKQTLQGVERFLITHTDPTPLLQHLGISL